VRFEPLLRISDLHVRFDLGDVVVRAVDGVDLEIHENETLGLIGESGSGKSVLGLSVLKLLPPNVIADGGVWFAGMNLAGFTEEEMRKVRGKDISWIPQDPATSLNPVLKMGFQIAEPMVLHTFLNKARVWQKTVELLQFFDIRPAKRRIEEYPHQYSGGMKQRSLVAMGTSTRPKLIIADEPTKGVDNLRKNQVASVFRKIKHENGGLAVLLITHDLSFARALCDRIAAMYCGKIMEITSAKMFFEAPLHPYVRALLESLPDRGLKNIPGEAPGMVSSPGGCRFHPRCGLAGENCRRHEPPLIAVNGAAVRCWQYA